MDALSAADEFRSKQPPDGHIGPFPWWHGWVIVDAFLAGVEWQKTHGGEE